MFDLHTGPTYDDAVEAAAFLRGRLEKEGRDDLPAVALILGSGLGALAEDFEHKMAVPYADIPGFPVSTVQGHAGQLVFGRIGGVTALAMQGRFHMYEGYDIAQVVFPVRVFALMGISNLIVTNAAGGLNPDFSPGDLMLITDHINLTGRNPLIGRNDERFGPRFPDMSYAYDKMICEAFRNAASQAAIRLREGVYLAVTGPNYETPAEVKAFRTLGADAAGMSTVPEVIAAVHSGLRVGGISCITNAAAGISQTALSHEEVTQAGVQVKDDFRRLLELAVQDIARIEND